MWRNKKHSYDRLISEKILWMTTVSDRGTPSTAPVWYHVESDTELVVYSRDPSQRVTNLGSNERVTLSLTTDGWAKDVVVVNGTAVIDRDAMPADTNAAFVAKYEEQIDNYGWTARWFAENYPTTIRIDIRSVRGS